MPEDSLYNRRLENAQITGGMSSGPIYRRSLELIRESGLRGDLLEFGAGSGALIRSLESEKIFQAITGIDILPRPENLPDAVQWLRHDLNFAMPLADGLFDTVISTEVIEHLENPRAMIRECYRVLKPGGALLVTTPNQESVRSLCALIFGGHYAGFLGAAYPAHITALLKLDLARILTEAGFKQLRFEYTRFGGIPKLPYLSWQTISCGVLRGRLWSDNIIALAFK